MSIAIVRWLCLLAAIGPIVTASRAGAFTITELNVDRYSFVDVIYHPIGDPYAYPAHQSYTPETNAVNLGYAGAASSNSLFHLTASSYVHGTLIGPMGFDHAVAEGVARYNADVVFGGGTGLFTLRITPIFDSQASQTGSTDAQLYTGLSGWGISDPSGSPLTSTLQPDGSIDYALEHGYTYRFESVLTAYSYALAGFETSRNRSLQLSLTEVPEPSTAMLLALGLGGIAAVRRRYGAASRPGRSARTIAAGVARGLV